MRRLLTIVVCLCTCLMARGQTDSYGYLYWFDQNTVVYTGISTAPQWHFDADVSSLKEGMHSLNIQVEHNDTLSAPTCYIFIKTPQIEGIGNMRCLFWVDGALFRNEQVPNNNGRMTWTIDVSSLTEGVHQYMVQTVMPSGECSDYRQGTFLYTTQASELDNMRCYYMVDDATASTAEATTISNGLYHFDLDVSTISDGLHHLSYWLVGSEGSSTAIKTAYFTKIPLGGSGITQFQYWINEREDQKHTTAFNPRKDTVSIISLLPVETQPLRSKNFQFAIKNGQPLIYAKNDIHIRFTEASGRFTDVTKAYVDEQVSEQVTPIGELQATQTFQKVADNSIRWYTVNVEPGDTVAFKSSQACTMQLFSPSGEEVYKRTASEAVSYSGVHTWESGTYYLAVHDVTGTQNNMTIDYMHMDKYDVVDWDVHTVGNGGCSTITFKGNGFRDLYRVDLYNAVGDTIRSVDVGHESDAETSVTFDFSDSEFGQYNAVFRFTEEDKHISEVVYVEEATPFDFTMNVQYAKQFLLSSGNTYTFTIENKGNMTAYDVPLPILIYVPNSSSLSRVDVGGFCFRDFFEKLNGGIPNPQIVEKQKVSGDLCFFISDSTTQIQGFPYVYYSYIRETLPPNGSKMISVKVKTTTDVHVYMDYPYVWPELSPEETENVGRVKAQRKELSQRCLLAQSDLEKCYFDDAREKNGEDRIYYSKEWCANRKLPKDCPPPPNGDGSHGVNSFDPNDIYGYLSDSGTKFLADSVARVNYTIEFENDTTFATASAHTIVVKDTLDSRYFDLNTFAPTMVKIGDKQEYIDGTPNFVKTIDMRPEINAIAQVTGEYDQTKGIATWTFQSLDPMTMEPTDDLMQGILPVNYNGTSGIGEVGFDIGMKPNKGDGTEVSNRACITFDYEEAIMTPTWTNIVDATRPTSRVVDGTVVGDSIVLQLEGEDNLSGIWKYDVYAQQGQGAPWVKVAENVTGKECTVAFYSGIEYGFCAVATDMAGNVEQKTLARDEFGITQYILGDVNDDGHLTMDDVTYLVNIILGKQQYYTTLFADVNRDGKVTIADVTALINMLISEE